MTLHLQIIPDLAHAVAPLTALLRAPVSDPLASEWVVAPSQGVHRWLAEQLAESLGATPGGRDGIAANIRFAFPGALVTQALGGRLADDPWEVSRLTPAVLTVLERNDHARPPGYTPERRVAVARQVADRFDRYHVHRRTMIEAWARGDDVLAPVRGEPALPVPSGQHWQPKLWRALRELLGVPSPPERVAQALTAITAGTPPPGLPPRVMLVGSSALAPLHLEVLLALANTVEVHAWLVHPSPGVLRATLQRLQREPVRPSGWRDPQDAHPLREIAHVALLDSWLRPAQGMQRQLAVRGVSVTPLTHVEPAPATRLARLQALLRTDAPPAETPAPPVLADQSVRLHGCHGPARQAEVLREALWHAFRELPGLRPEEVLLVAPDLPGMAPHLETVFGTMRPGASAEPGQLPVVVADRSLREVNVVAEALVRLLETAMGRAGVADLRALTDLAVVRARFGVDTDTVARWMTWAERAGVAWGLSARHRRAYQLPETFTVHSWAHAAQRLALGALLPDGARPSDGASEAFAGTIPARGVDAEDLPQIGALLALLAELTALADALHGEARPIGGWCTLLQRAVAATCQVTREQQPQLAATLGMLQALAAEAAGCPVPVRFAEWHPLLLERLVGTPGHVVLRGGAITATSLVPLRGVPYRVVCLVGLDDGALVRGGGDGDDLLLEQPLLGDPDPSGEQRQALLDTVLAARERLIVTYTAHDVRSGKPVPAIAPLAELRELLQRAGVPTKVEEDAAVPDVQVLHPRHAIDARTFTAGALGCAGAFGHQAPQRDAVGLLTRTAPSSPAVRVADAIPPADAPRVTEVTLDELATFLQDPLRLYVKRTAGIDVYEQSEEEAAVIPLTLDKKARVKAAAALLERVAPWRDDEDAVRRAIPAWRAMLEQDGSFPPGVLGDAAAQDTAALVEALRFQCSAKQQALTGGDSIDIDVSVSGGVRVRGRVDHVFSRDHGRRQVRAGAERQDAQRQLVQRLQLLALATSAGAEPVSSWWIGEHATKAGTTYATEGELAAGEAGQWTTLLDRMVALYVEALRVPRPLVGKTGEKLVREGRAQAVEALRGWTVRAKAFDPAVRLYGTTARLQDLFPPGGPEEAFLHAYVGVLDAMPTVKNSRAASNSGARKAKAQGQGVTR
jgi:exodeoxyribonuclease V gamma subunit